MKWVDVMSAPKVLLFFILLLSSRLFAQLSGQPEPALNSKYSSFFFNTSLQGNNPGLYSYYLGQVGGFSEIRSFAVYGSMGLGERKMTGVGGMLYGSQEGPLIQDNRMMLSAWQKVALQNDVDVCFSASIGFLNFKLGSTKSTSGISEWLFNVETGLALSYNKWTVGVSLNQIPSSVLTPLKSEISFSRFATGYVATTVNLNSTWDCDLTGFVSAGAGNDYYNLQSSLTYKAVFSGGLGARSQGGLLTFAYQITKAIQYEISLGYQFVDWGQRSSALNPYQISMAITE